MWATSVPREWIARQLRARNEVSTPFFDREAARLAALSRRMSERFQGGGRLLVFGRDAAVSDAQHVAVEFLHPVLVGKRALPVVDVSHRALAYVRVMLRSGDMLMACGAAPDDRPAREAIQLAEATGALAIALPGEARDYGVAAPAADPFVTQELMEIAYHTVWETIHVFFEHQPRRSDSGDAGFLYPFLSDSSSPDRIVSEVAASIRSKATCVERLRAALAAEQADSMAAAVLAMHERITAGATVLCFGNGGSATDATDLALDLAMSPKPQRAVPAVSLAADAATLTGIANDVGSELMFVRQLIALGQAGDVAVAISTSGGSRNIIAALVEARARGLLTIALVGYDGGEILRRGLADHVVVVGSDQIPRVQEAQASVYHIMRDALDVLSA